MGVFGYCNVICKNSSYHLGWRCMELIHKKINCGCITSMRNVSCINLDIFFNLMQVANSSTFLVMIVKPGLGYSPVKTILLFWEHYDFMNTKIDYILLLTLGFFFSL